MITDIDDPGLSLEGVRKQISQGGVEFELQQACGTAAFQPLARLTLNEVAADLTSHDVAFDPSVHSAPDVRLAPVWLADLRRRAYRRSREGRHAD
jgi:hypothetical protein